MDETLSADESAVLALHLSGCPDCQSYANEMHQMERLLPAMMKSHWGLQPVPLPVSYLLERSTKTRAGNFLAIRTAAIGLVFVALFFSAWQFLISGPLAARQISLSVAPVPTPLVQTVQFIDTAEACAMSLYTVQGSDTLASLSARFSVSEEEIMEINGLKTDRIGAPMQLVIPVCNFTPTGTVHPATFTTTYTPVRNLKTSTPGW
jgi:LysM repeat protein